MDAMALCHTYPNVSRNLSSCCSPLVCVRVRSVRCVRAKASSIRKLRGAATVAAADPLALLCSPSTLHRQFSVFFFFGWVDLLLFLQAEWSLTRFVLAALLLVFLFFIFIYITVLYPFSSYSYLCLFCLLLFSFGSFSCVV